MQTTDSLSTRAPGIRSTLLNRLASIGLSPLFITLVAILAVSPFFLQDDYIRRLIATSLFYGMLAMAFDFTGGFINAVNFGFAGFVGLGAYVSALLVTSAGFDPWISLIPATVITGLIGFFTGILTLPLRGIYISLMSWFVGLTLMALASAMEDITRGSRGIVVPPLFDGATINSYIYIFLVLLVVMYVFLRLIIQSRVGLAFRAIGQNFDAARASGINPTFYKLLNFTLSCACAGLLGGLYSHFVGIVTPDMMDTGHTMEVMALSFIGGSGSLLGGTFAAFLLIPAFDSLKSLMEYRLVIYGMLLILVMIFYPAGLSGLYNSVRARISSKKQSAGK